MGPATLKELSASGEVAAAGQPRTVFAVTLTAGSDAATATYKSGGAGGTTLLTLKALANSSVSAQLPGGAAFGAGCYVTLTGTGPVASVLYS